MANIQIIQLQLQEWEKYKKLRLEALQQEPQAYYSTYEGNVNEPDSMWQERLQEAEEGKTQWLSFAKLDEELVGMVGAFSKPSETEAEIIAVYVSEKARGQGVGNKLMQDLLFNIQKNSSIKKLHLEVSSEQIAAVHLYKNCGFVITGKSEKALGDGKLHDVYTMEKVLNKE